jgi:purine-binding chemotaxis protein CheW
MNLRGRVVAIVELAPLVGLSSPPLADGKGQVLVLERERRTLGLLVEGVIGVEALGAPEASAEGGPVRGRVTVGGAPVAVLDADALVERASALFGDRAGGRPP